MGWTEDAINDILDSGVPDDTYYVGLTLSGVEISDEGYARGGPVSLAAASGKARANDALVSIDPVAGGTATGWSLYDAATDGNLVGGPWDLLDPATGLPYAEPVALDAGIVFGIGDLVIPLENPA